MEVWLFRLLVVAAIALFARQMLTRHRLMARAPGGFDTSDLGARIRTFVSEVVFQSRTIRLRPIAGLAHLGVFWGFCAFAGYTTVEGLRGLGIVDLTGTAAFHVYRLALVPFSVAALAGIVLLAIRRGILRPPGLGATVSKESLLIAAFIAILMITFLVDTALVAGGEAHAARAMAGVPLERANWWAHMVVILAFTVLIPDSKHLHLLLSPATVFLRAPVLGTVRKLDFEKEEIGLETVGQLEKKQVLDAFTCVECGRCQDNCPAHATGKVLNPKKLILQNEEALLAGRLDQKLPELYDPDALWQCTTCGACQNECPVGIEHLPLVIGARRGQVSNGEAPPQLAPVYNNLERRGNLWGLLSEQRQKFLAAAGLEIFDPAQHDVLVWLGCAGSFEADFQKSLKALFAILRAKGVRFGVLAKEKCNGDVPKRTGNEYLFQELATGNVEELNAAGVKKVITSCPHCLKTLGHDYREFGFRAEVVHSAVFVEELTTGVTPIPGVDTSTVVYHDPCYLGRYAKVTDQPRALLTRVGATVVEPERTKDNPFCCGAGGGLLFEEHEPGKRISDERYEQLTKTGAETVVMACPFCSIMLKGAQASSDKANAGKSGDARPVVMTDLMSYVADRLIRPEDPGVASTPGSSSSASPGEPAP
jgi:Fe-S oxidoreductase